MSTLKFCVHCGNSLPSGHALKFCISCGKPVASADPGPTNRFSVPTSTPTKLNSTTATSGLSRSKTTDNVTPSAASSAPGASLFGGGAKRGSSKSVIVRKTNTSPGSSSPSPTKTLLKNSGGFGTRLKQDIKNEGENIKSDFKVLKSTFNTATAGISSSSAPNGTLRTNTKSTASYESFSKESPTTTVTSPPSSVSFRLRRTPEAASSPKNGGYQAKEEVPDFMSLAKQKSEAYAKMRNDEEKRKKEQEQQEKERDRVEREAERKQKEADDKRKKEQEKQEREREKLEKEAERKQKDKEKQEREAELKRKADLVKEREAAERKAREEERKRKEDERKARQEEEKERERKRKEAIAKMMQRRPSQENLKDKTLTPRSPRSESASAPSSPQPSQSSPQSQQPQTGPSPSLRRHAATKKLPAVPVKRGPLPPLPPTPTSSLSSPYPASLLSPPVTRRQTQPAPAPGASGLANTSKAGTPPRGVGAPTSADGELDDKALREKVVEEIIQTEADYVRDLKLVVDLYLLPLRKENLLTKNELSSIFSNVEMILQVNDEFLTHLQNDQKKIGDAFLKVVDYLKLYSVYCSNQEVAINTVRSTLIENKKFGTFAESCRAREECRNLDLASFLIKPIQRICKYPLLLKELLKYTPESHPDHKNLESALQRLKDTVDNINTKSKAWASVVRIQEISTLLDQKGQKTKLNLLDDPSRKLLNEGPISRITTKQLLGKQMVWNAEGYYFLLSDLLLFAKPTGPTYHLKCYIPLTHAECSDVEVDNDNYPHTFQVIALGRENSITFCTESPERKEEVKMEIETAITTLLDKKYNHFVEKERKRTLTRSKGNAAAAAIMSGEWQATSFEDWRNKHSIMLAKKPTGPHLATEREPKIEDGVVRFVCHGQRDERRVLKIPVGTMTLAALQEEIRRKFFIGPAVGFKMFYPHSDGSWQMVPLNSQEEFDHVVASKISDLYLSWLS